MYGRRDRINERDVPESQHTIFIRGLPGSTTTEEIRGFFEKDGSCSFDFVKVSPDRSKLYVAVRFDSKTNAREVMEKYGGQCQILGHDVEMTWFRDIRRYLAHCAKQGIQPSRFRNDGGDRRDGGYRPRRGRSRSISPLRTRDASRSKSQSKSRSHSISMSPERDAGRGGDAYKGSQSRSATPRSRSHSARSRSVSKSASSTRSSPPKQVPAPVDNYSDIQMKNEQMHSPTPPPLPKKSKKKKERKDRKRRRQQHSPSLSPQPRNGHDSDMEASEGEIKSPKINIKTEIQEMGGKQQTGASGLMTMTSSKPIGPSKPQEILAAQAAAAAAYAQQQQANLIQKPPPPPQQQQQQVFQSYMHSTGSLAMGATTGSQGVLVNSQIQQQQQPDSSSEYARQQQQNANKFRHTFSVDLDPNASKMAKYNTVSIPDATNVEMKQPTGIIYQQFNGSKVAEEYGNGKRPRIQSPSPPEQQQQTAVSIRNAMLRSISPVRESGPLASNVFKDIQRQILQDIRYKAQPETDEEETGGNFGGLRLSSLSKQRMTEDMREEKVAKLSPELRERVTKKKRQLELSYRHDCETFGLVTRKLIEKDKTLEDRLKVALLETMRDLESETMKQLDEFLEQLSYICA